MVGGLAILVSPLTDGVDVEVGEEHGLEEEHVGGNIADSGGEVCTICISSFLISAVTLGTRVFCGDGKTFTVTFTLSGETPPAVFRACFGLSFIEHCWADTVGSKSR